jgi:quinol monooxygenase YgiN
MQHARASVYQITGSFDDVVSKVREQFVPILRKQEGFVSYNMTRDDKDRSSILNLSVWETKQNAEASDKVARDWAEKTLADSAKHRSTHLGEYLSFK